MKHIAGLAIALLIIAVMCVNTCDADRLLQRCDLAGNQTACLKAGKTCRWCEDNDGNSRSCYDYKTQTCCKGTATVCDSETETCCIAQGQTKLLATCCKKSSPTGAPASCCPGSLAGPQCCTGNATCCNLGGVFNNFQCCSGHCMHGYCCSETEPCGKFTCCKGMCMENKWCMGPPPMSGGRNVQFP